jgi:NADH:ubiquinone oxidoreductase subunit 5 (subunit L)/multisubunit Na+/H+ antiporter MnhA subunit
VYTALTRKLYVDDLYALLVRGAFFALATAVAWFDRNVVDGAVNLVGEAARRGGELLRRTVTGKVQGYALLTFGGVAAALVVVALLGLGSGR